MIQPNTITTTPALHKDLYRFICSVIATRKRLIRNDSSRKNKMRMCRTVEQLDKLITVNRYDNDRKMSSFFIRHAHELEDIMPGTGSKQHDKFCNEFKNLNLRASQYLSKNS